MQEVCPFDDTKDDGVPEWVGRCTLLVLRQNSLVIPRDFKYDPINGFPEGVAATGVRPDGIIAVYLTSEKVNKEPIENVLKRINSEKGFNIEILGYPIKTGTSTDFPPPCAPGETTAPTCSTEFSCNQCDQGNCGTTMPACACPIDPVSDSCQAIPVTEGFGIAVGVGGGTQGLSITYGSSGPSDGGISAGHVLVKDSIVGGKINGVCQPIGYVTYVDETMDFGIWTAADRSYVDNSWFSKIISVGETSGRIWKQGATTFITCGEVTDPSFCFDENTYACNRLVKTSAPACEGDSGAPYYDSGAAYGGNAVFGIVSKYIGVPASAPDGSICLLVKGSFGPKMTEISMASPISFEPKGAVEPYPYPTPNNPLSLLYLYPYPYPTPYPYPYPTPAYSYPYPYPTPSYAYPTPSYSYPYPYPYPTPDGTYITPPSLCDFFGIDEIQIDYGIDCNPGTIY